MILKLIWLMLPAYFANMTPLFVQGIFKKMAFPLDLGLNFRNKRIFGSHKTFRGLFFGIAAAMLVYLSQQILYDIPFFQELSLISYDEFVFFGFWLGFGALLFDLIKSFFKRQLDIQPGKSWFVFDQLDYVLGALFFMSFYYSPGWLEVFLIILLSFALTIIVKHIGFWLGIDKAKW